MNRKWLPYKNSEGEIEMGYVFGIFLGISFTLAAFCIGYLIGHADLLHWFKTK